MFGKERTRKLTFRQLMLGVVGHGLKQRELLTRHAIFKVATPFVNLVPEPFVCDGRSAGQLGPLGQPSHEPAEVAQQPAAGPRESIELRGVQGIL